MTHSSLEEILFGVPQGSVLGPLLFNIFLWDLFWIICRTNSESYAADNTSYVSGDSIDDVIKSFKDDSINLFKWFLDNHMKVNSDKYYLITSKQILNLKIGNISTENSTCEKIQGVKVNNKILQCNE